MKVILIPVVLLAGGLISCSDSKPPLNQVETPDPSTVLKRLGKAENELKDVGMKFKSKNHDYVWDEEYYYQYTHTHPSPRPEKILPPLESYAESASNYLKETSEASDRDFKKVIEKKAELANRMAISLRVALKH